jgi:hypothetical protein
MKRYRIVYRDGMVGDPRTWESVLRWIDHYNRRIPYPLRAAFVVAVFDAEDLARA